MFCKKIVNSITCDNYFVFFAGWVIVAAISGLFLPPPLLLFGSSPLLNHCLHAGTLYISVRIILVKISFLISPYMFISPCFLSQFCPLWLSSVVSFFFFSTIRFVGLTFTIVHLTPGFLGSRGGPPESSSRRNHLVYCQSWFLPFSFFIFFCYLDSFVRLSCYLFVLLANDFIILFIFFFPMILFFFVRIISGMHSKKLLLGFSYLICTTSLSLSLSFHVGVLAYIKFFACVSACCTHYVIYFHFDL